MQAESLTCSATSSPLVREPASMASDSSSRKAQVRCFGVSPPWQPTTRSSTARSALSAEFLRHFEELEEVLEAPDVGDEDDPRLLVDEAEAAEASHHLARDGDIDTDLAGDVRGGGADPDPLGGLLAVGLGVAREG